MLRTQTLVILTIILKSQKASLSAHSHVLSDKSPECVYTYTPALTGLQQPIASIFRYNPQLGAGLSIQIV